MSFLMERLDKRLALSRVRSAAVATVLCSALTLTGSAAQAIGVTNVGSESTVTTSDLTEEQQEAIKSWESPQSVSSGPVQEVSGASVLNSAETVRAAASPSRSRLAKIYRGGRLMWAEERVDFRFNHEKVTTSSGYQSSGAVFPNNVSRLGTKKILSAKKTHSWRGQYKVGAGVPTPWGNVNVYNVTSTARIDVKHDGSWSAWWVD